MVRRADTPNWVTLMVKALPSRFATLRVCQFRNIVSMLDLVRGLVALMPMPGIPSGRCYAPLVHLNC